VEVTFERELLDIRIENSSPVVQSRVRVVGKGCTQDFQIMPA
jgi:hypothetical protein